ncbi:hypothetical protein [Enterococcus avium]|uniref:hypothetical protein n=1 Tax=Enterococcus avium TaxID=33945 RepID=UPI002AB1602C|nr:hypothetical protein [Enterococcus avium]
MRVFDYKFASTGLNDQMADRLKDRDKICLTRSRHPDGLCASNMKDRMLFKLVYDPKTHAILGAQICLKKT